MRCLLVLTAFLLAVGPLHAARPGFEGFATFLVIRSSPEQDPARDTEQKIADVFRRHLEPVGELSVMVEQKPDRSVTISSSSPKAEARNLFERATAEALALKVDLPIRLRTRKCSTAPPAMLETPADRPCDFNASITYQVMRKGENEDPQRKTERLIADVFHRLLGASSRLTTQIQDKDDRSLEIYVWAPENVSAAFKTATKEAMELGPTPLVRVVSKRLSLRQREDPAPRAVKATEMKKLEQDWQEAWEQSMKRMEEKLDRSLRTGLRKALVQLKRVGQEIDAWEPFEEKVAEKRRRGPIFGRRAERTAEREGSVPLQRGGFDLAVDEAKGKVSRLVAFDAEFGAILTRMATRLPLNFVFGGDALPRRRVSLSLVDCDVNAAVEALAAAARAKTEKRGPLVIFREE